MCDDFQLILLDHLLILNNMLFICVGADFQKFIKNDLQIINMSSHSNILSICIGNYWYFEFVGNYKILNTM